MFDFLSGYHKELIHELNSVGMSDSMNVIRKCQKCVIAQNCEIVRLERLNNLSLSTVTPNFVAIFVFDTASSFIERISFSEIEVKREAILFLFGCSEVNSTWIITSGLANQRAPKALFICMVYTNYKYDNKNNNVNNNNRKRKKKTLPLVLGKK